MAKRSRSRSPSRKSRKSRKTRKSRSRKARKCHGVGAVVVKGHSRKGGAHVKCYRRRSPRKHRA